MLYSSGNSLAQGLLVSLWGQMGSYHTMLAGIWVGLSTLFMSEMNAAGAAHKKEVLNQTTAKRHL